MLNDLKTLKMLFKQNYLAQIADGTVNTAFRKWKKPTVKTNGTLITPIGQLKIIEVLLIDYASITDHEINAAGYQSRQELDKELSAKSEGELYKITFELLGDDPRIALRETSEISEEEFIKIKNKLKRLDSAGVIKDWTLKVLNSIKDHPGKRAIELAKDLGYDKMWLKPSIRKLKSMGLTISLPVGYKLSPRGKEVLHRLGSR